MSARSIALLATLCLAATAVAAADTDKRVEAARKLIVSRIPTLKAEDISPSPLPGIYLISTGGQQAYVDAEARYLIQGDMVDIATRVNVTEQGRKAMRLAALAKIDEAQMIVFSPEHPQHTITVFTDVECGYCRKLHSEMAQLNELGIRVRYVAYPRSGPKTRAWATMEQVWCSKDRNDAITQAKLGKPVSAGSCDAARSVASEYELGNALGIDGTPAIVLEDGSLIGGYVPASQLAKQLDGQKQAIAAAK